MVMQIQRGCAEGELQDLKKQQNFGKLEYHTESRKEYSIVIVIWSSPRG